MKESIYNNLLHQAIDVNNAELTRLKYAFIQLIFLVAGVALIWLSARVEIPFFPVPFTMQTAAILFIGIFYGSKLGTLSVVTYMILGMMGYPVFAGTPEKGIGLAYMMGPTGGYLLGFVVASFVTAFLCEKGFSKNLFTLFLNLLFGVFIIYAFGLAWLSQYLGFSLDLLKKGALFFLAGDLIKIVIVTLALYSSSLTIKKLKK